MRIFLDVGAHIGQTAAEVLKPEYAFDRVVCFEPVLACADAIKAKLVDSRLEVLPFGLHNLTGTQSIYGGSGVGATMFADKKGIDQSIVQECHFEQASLWLQQNVKSSDAVFMKLNCEGAEFDILDDLMTTGAIGLIDYIMVDFDVRKIPSQRDREGDMRRRIKSLDKTSVYSADLVMVGKTHGERLRNWLLLTGAVSNASRLQVLRARSNTFRQRLKLMERRVRKYLKAKN